MSMNNLHNIREKNNLEIKELVEDLNKKFGTKYEVHHIWEWENGKNEPKMEDALVPHQEFLDSEMKKLKDSVDDVSINK
ncbi:XRE family transcriptional regulator [Staphylococcus capitis]|nr:MULTISPECIES: transcriptional regulator [Staphylococcus]MCM3507956.1 XRE family transcriptional regulator [Staphylococcus capitis]MDH9599346.1 XRE family transcriptional regulator [Staphylococcus capitis]MDH9623896.1 XRE family transcriptional regulator [Staphylococcus capitis]MDS4062107.1 XRE family transcriptional regulator [Staphylococcus capitis]